MRRLTAAEVRRRRQIAAREDLSRAQQARLVGITKQAWLTWVHRHGLGSRDLGAARGALADARLRNGGLIRQIKTQDGSVDLPGAVSRALGVQPGERVRVKLDALSRRVYVEPAGRVGR